MQDYLEKSELNCNSCEFKSPIFKFLSNEELALIHQNKTTVVFKPGETIRKQGYSHDPCNFVEFRSG